MELESRSQTVYRLVVALDDRDVVFDAPLFTRFKQARGRVAAVVCREAQAGIVRKVTLERGTPRPRSAICGRHVVPTTRGARAFRDAVDHTGPLGSRRRPADPTAERDRAADRKT